jgi:outer membrane lipoprotein-sorting protein
MKGFILLACFIFLLISAQFSYAQTLDELVTKYENARGGKAKLNAIKSLYMEGITQRMGNEITVKVTKEQGKLSRTEFDFGSGNGFTIITDKEGWNMFSMRSTTPTKMADEMVAGMQTELDIAGPLVDYATKGYKAELIGKDTVNAVECYKIKLVTKTGKEIFYWLNSTSYLLVQSKTLGGGFGRRREGNDAAPAAPQFVTTLYRDYIDIEGMKFAQTIEMVGGQGAGSTTFDKIELNKPVDAKLYKPE